MLKKARQFALCAHGDQLYGELPYSVHLDAVARILKPYGTTAIVIGYLHDVLEDTPVSETMIADQFGARIARCVQLVSDPPGKTRRERKKKANAQLAAVDEEGEEALALVVKTADRLANLEACVAGGNEEKLEMYRAEHEQFVEAVYRSQLCEDLWKRIRRTIES